MNGLVRRAGDHILLGQRLDAVGGELQESVGTDPVGSIAVLHASDHLALDHGGHPKERREHRDDRHNRQRRRNEGLNPLGEKPHHEMF